jgi:type II restriction/modification system DNA methylase subunit YeeA
MNGNDVVKRSRGRWIIDFGERTEAEASLFELPFEYVREHVKPLRATNRDRQRRENWWRLGRSGADLKLATSNLRRFIVTPRVARHRIFVWSASPMLPDTRLVAITRDDDFTMGLLQSRFHEAWSLRLGGWHGVGNDPQYTPTLGFETFPFPEGLTPNTPAKDHGKEPHAIAIAKVAKRLVELRNNWLNPPDLTDVVPEVVPGYADRMLAKNEKAAAELTKRTFTNLYNQCPQWLTDAHRDLDAAVAAAYGWPADISEDDALAKLLEMNMARTSENVASSDAENEFDD